MTIYINRGVGGARKRHGDVFTLAVGAWYYADFRQKILRVELQEKLSTSCQQN